MQSRWKPSLTPDWRPPSGNGWEITEIPEEIEVAENVRKAWAIRARQRQPNKNGMAAVNEMALYLHANGIAVSKDVRSIIENHADYEWCAREPSRCHKRVLLNAATRGKSIPEPAAVIPSVLAKRVSAPVRVVRTSGGCRSCGGGRVR